MIETPAHSSRFAQSYSSWSCSPAELHYASDCNAKVRNWPESDKSKERKSTLQFELLTTYHSKSPCKMSYTPKFHGVKFFSEAVRFLRLRCHGWCHLWCDYHHLKSTLEIKQLSARCKRCGSLINCLMATPQNALTVQPNMSQRPGWGTLP